MDPYALAMYEAMIADAEEQSAVVEAAPMVSATEQAAGNIAVAAEVVPMRQLDGRDVVLTQDIDAYKVA